MAERDRPHILVGRPARAEPYRRPPRGMATRQVPAPAHRAGHGARLAQELQTAQTSGLARREQRDVQIDSAIEGIYVVFESVPGVELKLESLDPRQGHRHPELVAVQEAEVDGQVTERATVFVPDGTIGYFLKRVGQYVETSDQESPRNRDLLDRIESIALASLEELWTDAPGEFPDVDRRVWWEIWLRRRDGHEESRLEAFADAIGARLGRRRLGFADRIVVLLEARAVDLANALDVLDDLAELRRPREPASLLALEPPTDQADRVAELAARTVTAPDDAPAVCVVDTGVHQPHSLLAPSLSPADCHACDPIWGVEDHDGHGTEMAGLALYGDVGEAILSGHEVRLRHRLESVKTLPPPPGANPPELYGAVAATAVSLVEIQAPDRQRVYSMAITAAWDDEADRFGQPSSWSAAVDALAAGLGIAVTAGGLVFLDETEESARRLFFISAGNVSVDEENHLARSDLEPIEDPGQAWNALTIGAYTDLDDLADDPTFADWTPVASRGELAPYSRTSVLFDRGWPIKPDVVLEGGNTARSPDGADFDSPEVLQLLTTRAPRHDQRLLTVTCATSAATAQAGHLGASILAEYPTLWPETVRALITHSAEWTDAMRQRFAGAGGRAARLALQRRYGMGVPDAARALRSATDALTLVVQDVIHPFDGDGRMREMHLHELPWPVEVLEGLGAAEVRMRVTLSYFIEPNPGRRGWVRRYSYASHGLRFGVRRPTESTDDFRSRVNQLARDDNDRRTATDSDASEWFFGPDQRTAGSLHTDVWVGTAADLAQRSVIAVFPTGGWWKERKDRDHSDRGARYGLVVSLETPEQDVDIWTPVAQAVTVPIEIDI